MVSSSEPGRLTKTTVMRWIDHWVGLPLCFTLGLLATLARRVLPRPERTIGGRSTLAVFKFFGLGSIIQATPLLRAIRRRYPESRLAFVTFDTHEALVRRLDVCTDLRVIRTGSPVRFVADVVRQVLWLRHSRTEAVVDLEFFSKFSTLLSFMSGARVRIGFHLNDFWRYSLLTHPIYFNYFRHIAHVYADAARRLDAQIDDPQLVRYDPGEAARESALRLLRDHGWAPGGRLAGVNVNAGDLCHERRWPMDRFADVVSRLLEQHDDLRVVLTGAPTEHAYVSSLLDHLPPSSRSRVIVAAGQWSLDEFVAALGLLDVFLTNDSGPMHLAAAEGVPTVSLWGPSKPDFYAPKGADNRVIYTDYPCSPCMLMFTTFEGMWCEHEGWCMHTIEADEVLEAVSTTLQRDEDRRAAARSST